MAKTPNIVSRENYTDQQTIPPNSSASGWGYWESISDAPAASVYGVGPAWIGGRLYWSDGLSWNDSGGAGSATELDVSSLGADTTGTTDCSSIINSALASLYAAGGGTLYFPIGVYRIDSAITIPGDSATPQKTVPISFVGEGARWVGRNVSPTGGSVLDLRGTDTYGKIRTNSLGLLSFTGLTFVDGAGTSTPFLYTTNGTLHVRQCAFWGSKTSAWDQDAIILGGINQVEGGQDWTDGFQGYGTVIDSCYFGKVRKAIYGRAFCNSVQIVNNTIWNSSGDATGSAIEIDGKPSGSGGGLATGNYVAGNLIELVGYKYGIRLKNASQNALIGNSFWDPTGVTTASVYMESTAEANLCVFGFDHKGYLDEQTNATLVNRWITNRQGAYSTFGPSSFPDTSYATSITKPLFPGFDGNSPLIQPTGSGLSSGGALLRAKRSAGEGTNAGTDIMKLLYSGQLRLSGNESGWIRCYNEDGTTEKWRMHVGSGSPEGVITAQIGSVYFRTNGGAATTFYVKESGTGNTGWVAK
jgi:hypothetical protein